MQARGIPLPRGRVSVSSGESCRPAVEAQSGLSQLPCSHGGPVAPQSGSMQAAGRGASRDDRTLHQSLFDNSRHTGHPA
eukprot:350384-Chlamydomonas_euryale.AAC.2